jgi:hypothetical protein
MLQGKNQVQVGQWDIDTSIRRSADFCPIACASRREAGFKWVSVGPGEISASDGEHPGYGGSFKSYTASPAITEWIESYDLAKEVAPITIEYDHDNLTVEIVS